MQFAILLFADDAVLVARDATELQNIANAFVTFCNENSLSVNTSKTKVMLVNCDGHVECNGV